MSDPIPPTMTHAPDGVAGVETTAGLTTSHSGPHTDPTASHSGPYTDPTPHARGGLGEVFRATDPGLNRVVAVKHLLPHHADRPDSRRRFLVEAEVTAWLEYPGVVPVYRLFADADGRPAYAMRFVQGATLDDAVRAYHAGPPDPVAFRRLLQSVLQMAHTVAYAHSRGVIHRDLKPQNVMLGKFGETLVVDWGLAKVVGRAADPPDGPAGEGTLVLADGDGSGGHTQMGSAVGTPAYMSPEQAAGRWDVIDPTTDVYGLGATLFAVVTGRPPLAPGNWPELQQKIQQGDFPRPRQVKADVPQALEAVCLRAMALKPADRYPPAAAVAADLEHGLADEPVTAYREPPRVRLGRWAKRNRTAVGGGLVLLLATLSAAGVGLVVLDRKAREVAAERNTARAAADEAEAVNAFLTDDLLGQANPDANSRDQRFTVEQALAKAAVKIDGNPKFADKPAVEATLRLAIGKTYFQLGKRVEAEAHLRRAVGLRQSALPPDHPATLAAQETFADFLTRGPERFDEAVSLARATWEARSRRLGPDHRDTLDSLDTYACSVVAGGRPAAGIPLLRECLAARLRTLGPDARDTLGSQNNLGAVLSKHGAWGEAVPYLRAVLAAHTGGVAESERALCASNLVLALHMNGDLAEAGRLADDEVRQAERRFGRDA